MRLMNLLIAVAAGLFFVVEPAFAEEVASSSTNWTSVGVAIAMAIASAGGAMSQGKAGGSALEGITRNPGARSEVFVPMILVLALIESLVALTFVIILIK